MKTALKLAAAGMLSVMLAVASLVSTGSDVPMASAASSDYFLKLEGVEGEISIESFSWGITSPRDSASGLPTGRRQHKPLIIRKELDKASPIFFRMANDPKAPGMKTLTLTKPGTEGAAGYTVTFFDVFVMEFTHSGDAGGGPVENVSFTYQKIEMK